MRNSKYVTFFLLLLFIGTSFANDHNKKEGVPIIQFQDKVYELGSIEMFKKYDCKFVFKNVGSGTLNISSVESACGCSESMVTNADCKRGESGEINIILDSPKKEGAFKKKLLAISNDPKKEKVELIIKGNVTCKVVYEPKKLLMPLKGEKANNMHFSLTSKDGQKFSIGNISSNNNCIGTDFDPNALSACHKVKIVPDYSNYCKKETIGNFNIELSHPECGRLLIPYTIIPEYTIAPSTVIVKGLVKDGKSITKTISIRNNYGERFEIESIHSLKGLFKVQGIKNATDRINLVIELEFDESMTDTKYICDNISIKIADGSLFNVRCIVFNF